MNLAYPFRFDLSGRSASSGGDDHIREMIEQVLFTMPGERVNRPDFGSGVMQMVFAGNSDELAAAGSFLIHGALQQWLSDVIAVERVSVTNDDATLQIVIEYTVLATQQSATAVLTQGAP
jgi:phage baseplate assembly protein W